ncbi:MAG: response regulator [Candidatus Rokubacteria bacterium]|nr:response regulator [Candidatus Rokubacteria bacterium]
MKEEHDHRSWRHHLLDSGSHINARLYEDLARKNAHLSVLFETARQATASLNLADILPQLAKSAPELIGADASSIRLLDRSGTLLEAVAHHGVSEAFANRGPVRPGEGVMALAVQDGQAVFVEDLQQEPRYAYPQEARAEGLRSAVVVALRSGDRTIGTLSVYYRATHRYTAQEVDLLAQFANLAAIAIERSRLFDELKRSYEEVQHTQEQLVRSEKFRALGEMAGGVAHDFNNLLTAILGRTQYLLLQLDEGEVPPKEVRRNLTVVERAALDGAETVRRLLEFTRATPRPGEAVAVDVNELLVQTVEVSRHRWKDEAEAKGHEIQVVLETGGVPPVAGNPAELREVLLNLVFNAIDAMPHGGTLTLSSWTGDGAVCLGVRDTGVGMSPEIRQRIFDPFFTTKGPKSSGLGLSACYGIIHRHEGEITVESKEGQGTTFTVRLPLRPAPPPRAVETPRAQGGRLRILVVDDEADVRETLQDILAAAGHEMCVAGSGAEGLETLERQPVDVVLTDLGMPGMTGWEVADRIKARWPHLKVALITGWGVRIEPAELETHGVDFLIAKPFQVKQILRTVSDIAQPRESSEPAARFQLRVVGGQARPEANHAEG